MVKGSLQMHMSSETTSDEMPSKKIRALAALPSPSTVKEKSRGEATLSIVETSKVSMSSSDIPEPDKVGVQEISSKATDQGPDVVGTTTSDREEIPSKGMPHKSMQQQTWVHRAPRTPKEPEVERQEVPGTLQKCTPVSCPWFFGTVLSDLMFLTPVRITFSMLSQLASFSVSTPQNLSHLIVLL
jgi:hypothetical protein